MGSDHSRLRGILLSLGPTLVWAGAAIGVSHLVQSTRAGAQFEFKLVWIILLVTLMKYPFFEFGPRYAAATGESLVTGYKRLGNLTLGIFVFLTICTVFTVLAAVTMVTASLFAILFNPIMELSLVQWSAILLLICAIILIIGRYSLLDKFAKIIMVVLSISTIFAVIVALTHSNPIPRDIPAVSLLTKSSIAFLIVLMGWMPSPIDVSVWNSMWTIERSKQTGHKPTVKEALFDFNLGYGVTVVMALCFLTLGALVMYGSGQEFSSKGVVFASQLVRLYTDTLGSWSYPLIITIAIATMFSTTLTCTDAYPRVLGRSTELIFPSIGKAKNKQLAYWIWMGIVIVGSVSLLTVLKKSMTFMIDLAVTLSFLAAPILAYINYRLVTSEHMPRDAMPPRWLKVLSILGIGFLATFSIVFIWSEFFRGI